MKAIIYTSAADRLCDRCGNDTIAKGQEFTLYEGRAFCRFCTPAVPRKAFGNPDKIRAPFPVR